MTNDTITPVHRNERMVIIDFLRGIAIFGILMVNMAFYNSPFYTQISDYALWDDNANKLAQWFIKFFFESKFYPLFSILFGIGFYIFMQKAKEITNPVMFLYRKRLFFLFLFGVLHVLLLWYADILIIYGLFGFVMTWFYKKSDKTIIVWTIIFILLPIFLIAAMVGMFELAMTIPEVAKEIEASFELQHIEIKKTIDETIVAYSSGSFSDIFKFRISEYTQILPGIIFMFPNVISLFLIGMLLGRKGIFKNLSTGLSSLRKIFLWCLPFAVILNVIYVYYADTASYLIPGWDLLIMTTAQTIGGPAMTLVYIYLITYLFHKGVFNRITNFIANVGRMAFTNYIAHSIICTTLFFSYGFGLYGQVNIWQGIFITVAIYLIQIIWSHYWLKYFKFGPLEWLWRTLTYGRIQTIKK